MSVSPGPFFTCFLTILFLTLYLHFIISYGKNIIYFGIKLIFVGIAFILFRMLIPLNFPFTQTIHIESLLRPLQSLLNYKVGNSQISVSVIIMTIWFTGVCYRLAKLFWQHLRYPKYLAPFLLKNYDAYPVLRKLLQQYAPNFMQVAIIPNYGAPSIFGLRKPILILPDIQFTEDELTHIILHEIRHYKNHDLWLKFLLNLSLCLHWCNPLMYLLSRNMTLAFELSNDNILLKKYTDEQKISYAECILKMARLQTTNRNEVNSLAFTNTKTSSIIQRTHFILSESSEKTIHHKHLILVLHSLLIGIVLLFSLIFVPENSSVPTSVEKSTMSITPENAYFIQTTNEYMLFVDKKYITTFQTIPSEFKNLQIKKLEDIKNETKN